MKTYILALKSHCEAPDFEISIEAKNKKEAIKKIKEMFDIDEDIIVKNLAEI